MADISHHQFVALLKKSKVVEPKKLQPWLEKNKKIASARKLAKSLVQAKLLTTWQAKFLLSGRYRLRIGNYFLLSRLRRDELGARYLAVHASLKRKVELQIFSRDLTSDTQRWKDMIQKASLVAKLDHPSLVHVYDIDSDDDRYFLVVEHVTGRPLDVQKEIFTTPQIGRLVLQCADGIEVAHQNNVVHGTIDQTDILLTEKGTVKLQNLTVSPMRSSNSGGPEAEPIADYQALAVLGEKILQANPGADGGAGISLASIFKLMKSDGPSGIEKLRKWVEATPDASAARAQVTKSGANPIFSPTPGNSSGVDLSKPRNSSIGIGDSDRSAATSSASIVEAAWSSRPFLIAIGVGVLLFFGIMLYGATRVYNNFVAKSAVAAAEKEDLAAKNKARYNAKEQKAFEARQKKNESAEDDLKPKRHRKRRGKQQKHKNNESQNEEPETENADQQMAKADGANLSDPEPEDNAGEAEMIEDKAAPTEQAPETDRFSNFFGSSSTETSANPDVKTAGDKAAGSNEIPPMITDPDEMEKLTGIGPAVAKALGVSGVKTYDQITKMSPAQLDEVLEKGGTNKLGEKKWKNIIEEAKPLAEVSRGKAQDHFRKVPSEFELPAVDSTEPLELTKILIPATYSLTTELVSPEGIAPRPVFFELDRQSSSDGSTWTVLSKKSKTSSKSTPVAKFTKTVDALNFAWLPEAANEKTAVYLRNCLMRLSTPDGKSTVSKLRKPTSVRPLRISEESLTDTVKFEIEGAPDFDKIQIQLSGFANRGIEITDPFCTLDSPAVVALKRRDNDGFMNLQVAFSRTGKTLKLTTGLVVNGSMIKKDQMKALEYRLGGMMQSAQQHLRSNSKNRDLQKAVRNAEDNVKVMKNYQNAIKWFTDGNGGIGEPINFDVSADFGDGKLLLVKTDKNMVKTDEKKKK